MRGGRLQKPPVFSRSVQVVTGTIPHATTLAKFFRSTPAEKEMGNFAPTAWRNTSASVRVIACSGAPDRYIIFSVGWKKLLWFSTSSVLENFAPSVKFLDVAKRVRRPQISSDSSNCRPDVYAFSFTRTSVYPMTS